MPALGILLAIFSLTFVGLAEEKKEKSLQLKDLPPAVQKAVQDNLKGGEIKNIGQRKRGWYRAIRDRNPAQWDRTGLQRGHQGQSPAGGGGDHHGRHSRRAEGRHP